MFVFHEVLDHGPDSKLFFILSLGKNRNQLEIPEGALRSTTPNDYHLSSSKKGFKRFVSDTIKELNEKLSATEDRRDAALKDTMRSIFNKFDKE